MFKIILGRDPDKIEKYGEEGLVFIGKQYVRMGVTTSLAAPVYLDVVFPHVVLVCGKRGQGKSYTMGVIVEGMLLLEKKILKRLCPIIMDTMGIYWTMKYPNKRDLDLLLEWGLEPKSLKDRITVYVPGKVFEELRDIGVSADKKFYINPASVDPLDWLYLFGLSLRDRIGAYIVKVLSKLRKEESKFSIVDIIDALEHGGEEPHIIRAAQNYFYAAESWGIFSEKAGDVADIVEPGKGVIIDISHYAGVSGGFNVRALVIGLVAKRIIEKRLISRKMEELAEVGEIPSDMLEKYQKRVPLVWMVVDEAHEFLPREGITPATVPLVQWLREGRQPGCSLILATQQPGKIHTDAITQADILISHRVTAEEDLRALEGMMQIYLHKPLRRLLMDLPRRRGAALVLDDRQERVYSIQIRPRITWHGGADATALLPETT